MEFKKEVKRPLAKLLRPYNASARQLEDLCRVSMDASYYCLAYAELGLNGAEESAAHFMERGWREGKNPAPWFDTQWYLATYEDVRTSGQNPFIHYLIYGKAEGRRPREHAFVGEKSEASVAESAIVADAPILGDLDHGNVLVDADFYLHAYPDAKAAIEQGVVQSAASHYAKYGSTYGYCPNPWFSPSWYANQLGEAVAGDPLEHYLQEGYMLGLDPGPYLDATYYNSRTDCVAQGVSPLEHFICGGHEYPNPAEDFFFAQFEEAPADLFGRHAEAASRDHFVSRLPAEFFSADGLSARMGSSVELSDPDLAERFEFSRRPRVVGAQIYLHFPMSSSTAEILEGVERYSKFSSEAVKVALWQDADQIDVDVVQRHRDRSLAFDIAEDFAALDVEQALIFDGRTDPALNAPAMLVDQLVNTPNSMIGASVLGSDYRVLTSGWQVFGSRLKPSHTGASVMGVDHFRRREVDSVDPRAFGFDRQAALSISGTAGDDQVAAIAVHAHQIRKSGGTVAVDGSVFVIDGSASQETSRLYDRPSFTAAKSDTDRPHVLVVDVGWLRVDQDAGSVYTFNILRLLVERGWDVSFGGPGLSHNPRYESLLAGIGVRSLMGDPMSPTYWENRKPDMVFLFRLPIAEAFYYRSRTEFPEAPIVFHTLDLHGLREQGMAELTGDAPGLNFAERTKVRELTYADTCDATTVVSFSEVDYLNSELPWANNRVLTIPVDLPEINSPNLESPRFCFFGSYVHLPNVDATHWLLTEVWPLVLTELPNARLSLAGKNMPSHLLGFDDLNVDYLGHVDDLDTFLMSHTASIVPLRFGAGIKGKILSSLAAGLPVIGTPTAVDGMNLKDGENVLVGETAQQLADAAVRIASEGELRTLISKNGRASIEGKYSMDAVGRQLDDLLASLALSEEAES